VAERVRAQAWNGRRTYRRGPTTVANGQLVANWLATFGPVVCEPHRETSWPETLVLDSTEFVYTDRWTGQRNQLFTLLNAAFTSPAAWQAFEAEVHRNLGRRELNRWVTHWAPLLHSQPARRAAHPAARPGHWANGAIEALIRTAREVIGDRAWTLRNRIRLNLLLDLVRLRINKLDSQVAYASAIRKHLDATGGRPVHTAAIADQDDANGRRVYSLRA
jgi:hypothetical protein